MKVQLICLHLKFWSKYMLNKLFSLLFLFLFLAGCGVNDKEKHNDEHGEEKPGEAHSSEIVLSLEAQHAAGIEKGLVETSTFSGLISIPAKVIANQNQEALVGSLMKGRVKKIFVNLGSNVSAGTPLFILESLEIGNIKSDFLKAKTALSIAKTNLERYKTLINQNAGSLKSLQESQSEFEKAKAEFEMAHSKIHSLGLSDNEVENISDSHISGTLVIKAPISGIVTERNIITGQLVDESLNAFRILNTSSFWIEGDLPENDLNKISASASISFVNSALPGTEFKGKLFFISPGVDPHTRTIKVRANVNNLNNGLKPESFGTMNIVANSDYRSIVIPDEALIKEGDKAFVFIFENDTTFVKTEVQTGKAFNGNIEIREGLKEGFPFVKKGVLTLKAEALKESFGDDD